MAQTKIGVVVFTKIDMLGRPTTKWALAAHPADLASGNASLFCIAECRNSYSGWTILIDNGSVSQVFSRLGWELVGVIELERLSMSIKDLELLVNRIPPQENNDNPSREAGPWTSMKWVIRTMHILESKTYLRLPCPPFKMSHLLNMKVNDLKRLERPSKGVLVIGI